MSRIKEISVSDLHRMLRKENHFDLLDIRTPAEIERGVLPNANCSSVNGRLRPTPADI